MDTAVVSEVLLFRLHIIYSLLLGSVLQPGDGATNPLQQLEAERKTRRKQTMIRLSSMRNLEHFLNESRVSERSGKGTYGMVIYVQGSKVVSTR